MTDRILIVEDEDTLNKNLVRYLEKQGFEADGFRTAEQALEAATQHEYSVAVVDVRLPQKDGITLTGELSERSPETIVLLMTAYGSVEAVIDALRAGAQDFLLKPVLLKDVARKVAHACEHRRLLRDNTALRRQLAERPLASVVARSREMAELLGFVRQIAGSTRTVLLEGESGTGKEVLARLIHDSSAQREGPFVPVSMAAVSEGQVESCLFGHERGAFAGADCRRDGVFRAANGGTLFLDEIADVPISVQAKLLRAIETKEVLPVGGDRPVKFDGRIVAASSRDLTELVREKRFRADLYFRLAGLRIQVPPLRARPDDVPPLAEMFRARHAKEHGRAVFGIEGAAVRRLLAYPWPGNARELSNVIERALLNCTGPMIGVADLPAEIAGEPEQDAYHQAMDSFERALIRSTLERAGGDRREAARILGLSLATLYRRLEKLGLKDTTGEAQASPESVNEARGKPREDSTTTSNRG